MLLRSLEKLHQKELTMAMMLSKKKRPTREEKPFYEKEKITQLVLDPRTAIKLVQFINKKMISSVDYPISTGKEAVVFRASTPEGKFLAVKIFKFETSAFVHMMDYVEGDPRFEHVKKQKRQLVVAWARKEFSNLRLATRAGAPVPEPVACKDNIVFMQFLGENGVPYSLLKDVELEEPEEVLAQIIDGMKKLFSVKLIHADLSAYNILLGYEKGKEKPFFIDVGQAVLKSHPRAREFLEKDCGNIANFFSKQGLKVDAQQIFKEVVGSA